MDALLSIPVAYRWTITLLFVGFIIGLSVTPGVERPDDNLFSWLFANTAPLVQKVLHVITYAVLAALWMWTLAGIESLPRRMALSFALALRARSCPRVVPDDRPRPLRHSYRYFVEYGRRCRRPCRCAVSALEAAPKCDPRHTLAPDGLGRAEQPPVPTMGT